MMKKIFALTAATFCMALIGCGDGSDFNNQLTGDGENNANYQPICDKTEPAGVYHVSLIQSEGDCKPFNSSTIVLEDGVVHWGPKCEVVNYEISDGDCTHQNSIICDGQDSRLYLDMSLDIRKNTHNFITGVADIEIESSASRIQSCSGTFNYKLELVHELGRKTE